MARGSDPSVHRGWRPGRGAGVRGKTEKERENTQKGRKVLVTDKVNAFIDTFA